MTDDRYEPTKAEMLASLLKRTAGIESISSTIQRSHRFPLHMYIQIENMARMADVSVSVIINELLDCGLQAIHEELSEDEIREIHKTSKEQVERPTKTERVNIKPKQLKAKK